MRMFAVRRTVARGSLALAGFLAAGAVLAREVRDWSDGWEFSFDKKEWRPVAIPHDWAIEGPFEPDGDTATGKLPWRGTGWYRTNLVLDKAPEGRRIFLDFDGVMCDGTVFVNGQPCARQEYGYLGMRADATAYLFAGTNSIVVKADTTKLTSRWYPGAGIYRRARIFETSDVYLDERDVFVNAGKDGDGAWNVRVNGEATSRRLVDVTAEVKVCIRSPQGEVVADCRGEVRIPPCGKGDFSLDIPVRNPELWELKPNAALYTAEISIAACGNEEDSIAVPLGFRTFSFGDDGFHLNGRRVQLKGVCLHSDLGILGMAFNRSAMRRELEALIDMGVNAIRTSHNAPAPELLELCDEMGLFVWDECFDKWNDTSARGDIPLEEFVSAKLAEFVRRDRNHPSVFVWSMGNEIPRGIACPPSPEYWGGPSASGTSAERCARFRNVVKALDPSRPVGMACCFPDIVARGDYDALDITGWNYNEKYMPMRKRHPSKPVLYTESASAISNWGHYAAKFPEHRTDYDFDAISIDSYDRNSAPWSDIADVEFARMERDRFVGGEFVWTGVDYLGEPTPFGDSPVNGRDYAKKDLARSSYFGVFDLLCLPKDRAWLYRSVWNKDAFTLHIVPGHWTFPEKAGASIPVYVYTSADEAELFLNGASLGRRRKNPAATLGGEYYGVMQRYRLMWDDVPYVPGELKAVAYNADGTVAGEETLRTAGEAAAVVLAPEKALLPPDGKEFVFVRIGVADARGTLVPENGRRIYFSVEGPGEIVSVGNSDPRGLESFKDTSSHTLYNGRAGLYIHRTAPGRVVLRASAPGLEDAAAAFD